MYQLTEKFDFEKSNQTVLQESILHQVTKSIMDNMIPELDQKLKLQINTEVSALNTNIEIQNQSINDLKRDYTSLKDQTQTIKDQLSKLQ